MFRTLTLAVVLAAPFACPALAQQGQPGAHFVENWDLDEDGKVTLTELSERRSDVFFTFDANDDGTLDDEEYVMFDEARAADMEGQAGHGGGGAMVRAEAGMHLEYNDLNGDGVVTREEFLERAPDWFAMLDRNKDGAVTTADFGRG